MPVQGIKYLVAMTIIRHRHAEQISTVIDGGTL
jgi:hypothetical protein